MYNKIKDPISNKNYKINSKKSLEILKKYILFLNGGFPKDDENKDDENKDDENKEDKYDIMFDKIKLIFKQQNNKIKSIEDDNSKLNKKIKDFESRQYKIQCFLEIMKDIYEELNWDKQTGKNTLYPHLDCCNPLEFWNTIVILLGYKSNNTMMTSTFPILQKNDKILK